MKFNFNENQTVAADKIESVPDDFRGLYEEQEDGTFSLGSDHKGVQSAIKAVRGLQEALVASRAEAKNAKGKPTDLSTLSAYGGNVEEIAAGVEEALKVAGKGKNEDVERRIEKARDEMKVAHKAELDVMVGQRDGYRGQLKGVLVDNEAVKALNDAGSIDADLVLPMLKQHVGVIEEDGKFLVRIVDAAGDPRYSGTTGLPMSIKDLVLEMKATEKYEPLFKSTTKPGGGTPPAPGRQRQGSKDLSPTEKISAGLGKR